MIAIVVVFKVCCNAMCVTVCHGLTVNISLCNMLFNLVVNNPAFVAICFLMFATACVAIWLVFEDLFNSALDTLGGHDDIDLLDQRRCFFL